LDDEEIENHPKTSEEIKQCCKDIKVLGKKELKSLISWWKAYRDDQRKKNETEETKAIEVPTKVGDNEVSDEEKELDEVSKQVDEMMVGYYVYFGVLFEKGINRLVHRTRYEEKRRGNRRRRTKKERSCR
jgi:cation transport regulator ChaB